MDHSFLAAADDLDKVLDDFEKNEEVSPDFRVTSHSIKKSPQTTPQKILTHTMNGDSSIHHSPTSLLQENNVSSNSQLPNINSATTREKSDTVNSNDSNFDLDLSEADFAPSPQSLPTNLTSLSFLPSNQGDGLSNNADQNQVGFSSLHNSNSRQGNATLSENQSRDIRTTGMDDTRKLRSDSNTQLGLHDFSSYLPTNVDRTLSFGDLKSMHTSSPAPKEINYGVSSTLSDVQPSVSDCIVSHTSSSLTSLTPTQSTEEVIHTEAQNYVSRSSSDQLSSPQRTLQSQVRPETSNTATIQNSVGVEQDESSSGSRIYAPSPNSAPFQTSLQSNVEVTHNCEENSVPDVSTTVSRPSAPTTIEQDIDNSSVVDRTSHIFASETGINTVVVSDSLLQDTNIDSSEISDAERTNNTTPSQEIENTRCHPQEEVDGNSEDSSSSVSSSVSSTLPDPKLMDEYVRQGARPKIIVPGQSPKHSPLKTNAGDEPDVSSSPSKVLPKIVQPQSSPSHGSPTKPVVGFQSVDNITVTDADLDALEADENLSAPLQGGVPQGSNIGPTQSVIPQGTNSTGHLSVVANMDDGDSPRVSPISKLLDRQFQPVSSSETNGEIESNEFASMDPFYNSDNGLPQETSGEESSTLSTQGIQDQFRPNLPVTSLQGSPIRGGVPQGSIQGPQQSSMSSGVPQIAPTPSTGLNVDITLTGDGYTHNLSSVPKQSNNANIGSQLNNSNSQLLPSDSSGVKGHSNGVKGQQVDSLLDISNTALQGLSLAMNAANSSGTQQQEIGPDAMAPISQSSPRHQGVVDHSPYQNMQITTPQNNLIQPQLQGQSSMPPSSLTMPEATIQNGELTDSPSRTQRSAPPSAFQLPPPEDPPSYQEVREATRREAAHRQGPPRPGISRQSLSLNFEHPPLRRTTAQPIPPSPIIEDATPETNINVPLDGPQNDLVGLINPETVPSQLPDQPNGLVPQTGLLLPGGLHVQHNTDADSRTSSIETDSDHESDFPPGLVPELSQELIQLGNVAPVWLPDSEATTCMMCTSRFTFRKRRHHCRACGKIFCSKCCTTRIKLKYMDSKEARVCVSCLNTILRAQSLQRQNRPPNAPDPRNPAEYCSTVPPTQQASQTATLSPDAPGAAPPSVMVPVNKSSLRRPSNEGSQKSKETRHVRFSDGIHPGVDQGDLPSKSATDSRDKINLNAQAPPLPPTKEEEEVQGGTRIQGGSRRRLLKQAGSYSLIPHNEDALPPIVCTTQCKGEFMVEENPDVEQLLADLRSEDNANPVVFVLNKNLLVMVKIVNLNCCVNRTCWCFATKGMITAGQDEIVIVLECLPDEKMLPKDIFTHLQTVYEEASKGNTVSHMSHSICSQPGFLGSRDHGGFLYLQPTFQCLRQLVLPEAPYLFAVLLQKWETPWAKVFPLRLLLRLGAEFRYYPCPLMSVRFRKPVFGEIGHTIMNLLADFKNYQYLLPVIPGVTILMKDRETNINFPKNRYDDVMKVLNNSNEHVMALAANFSSEADSHLVCIQNDDGSYQTQAINIQNKPRKVTGASFVVFNGALKSSSGLTAKSSIVEDGLMVQIRPEMMTSLRQAIREMQNFVIPCKSVTVETVEETVCVKWVDDDQRFNVGITSPIDGRSMEGVESVRIHNGTDFRGKSRSLRWTEVFFLENNEPIGRHHEPVDLSKLAESLSVAFSVALSNHLDELREMGLAKLGLRVTIDTEKVGYEAGSKAQQLPPLYMNELDNELIPVLHNAVSQHEGGPVVLELIFHIIE